MFGFRKLAHRYEYRELVVFGFRKLAHRYESSKLVLFGFRMPSLVSRYGSVLRVRCRMMAVLWLAVISVMTGITGKFAKQAQCLHFTFCYWWLFTPFSVFRHTVPDSVFLCFDERVSGGKNKGSYIKAGGISTELFPGCSQPLAGFLQCFRVLVEFVKKKIKILEVSSAVCFQMLVQFVRTFYQIFPDIGEVSPECFQAIFSLSLSAPMGSVTSVAHRLCHLTLRTVC